MMKPFVKNSRLAFLGGACLGGLAVFAVIQMQREGPVEAGITLATVGGELITVEEFSRMAELRSGAGRAAIDKRALLDEMILQKALVDRAKTEGMAQESEFRRSVENLLVSKIRGNLETVVMEPTEAEILAFYEETKDRYEEAEQRRLAMIMLETVNRGANETEAMRLQLEEVRKKVAGEDDEEAAKAAWTQAVARISSDRASRYRGGEIGWFGAGMEYGIDPTVITAGFALDGPGDVSGILEGEAGLFLVKLLEWKQGGPRSFESVEGEVRHRLIRELQKEAEAEFRSETLKRVEVEIRDKILDDIKISTPSGGQSSPPFGGR